MTQLSQRPAVAEDPFALDGKAIVVTGASSGIGAATAELLVRQGARVLAVGRDQDRLKASVDRVSSDGGECHSLALDVTEADAAERIVAAAMDRLGSLDSIVNNAGIFTVGSLDETGPDVLDEQYRVNVLAPYALTRAAAGQLGEGASIVFIGSNLVHRGLAGMVAYSASKGAIHAIAQTLAVELAPRGIRVNTVSPGVTETPMTEPLTSDPEAVEAVTASTPAGRLGSPYDVACAVSYLCSDASAYLVGATIVVDGGVTAS